MARNALGIAMAPAAVGIQQFYIPENVPEDGGRGEPTAISISGATVLDTTRGAARWDEHSRLASRAPRQVGVRTLFSYGGMYVKWMRMIATGQVERTKFQPRTNHEWTGEFNDALYGAGYPRNLGTTFKVPTVAPQALGTSPWQMQPRPQFKRPIYVNKRGTASGIRGVPATPTQGRYS